MKTKISRRSTSKSKGYSTRPFFTKSVEGALDSISRGSEEPFFNHSLAQPKLKIGHSRDKYEEEADRMADYAIQHIPNPDRRNQRLSSISQNAISRNVQPSSSIIQRSEEVAFPRSLDQSLNAATMTDDQINEEISLIVLWLEQNPESSEVQQRLMTALDSLQAELHTPQAKLTEDELNLIVQNNILEKLEQFRRIPIVVRGLVAQEEDMTFASFTYPELEQTVLVDAAYFINTNTATNNFQHNAADFRRIVRSVNASLPNQSLIVSGVPYSRGRAVQVGKATPEDLRLFIQEAIDQGIVRDYAVSVGGLSPNGQLVELNASNLKLIIDSWVDQRGVGVDCSGFVLQALIDARDKIRKAYEDRGVARAMPPSMSRSERSAASFSAGTPVTAPISLRPGDVWVSTNGGHVRVVTDKQLARVTTSYNKVVNKRIGPLLSMSSGLSLSSYSEENMPRVFNEVLEINTLRDAELLDEVTRLREWLSNNENILTSANELVEQALIDLESVVATIEVVEFGTAESSGDSSTSIPGPTSERWYSESLTAFGNIRKTSDPSVIRTGTFFRHLH